MTRSRIASLVAVAGAAFVMACNGDEVTSAGTLALEPGSYTYSATTRGDVAITGVLIVWYGGADTLSADILAADPRGQPYLEGHFVGTRDADGSYRFDAPRSPLEPTGSRYLHTLRRTKEGLRCELRDERAGSSVSRDCRVGRVGE